MALSRRTTRRYFLLDPDRRRSADWRRGQWGRERPEQSRCVEAVRTRLHATAWRGRDAPAQRRLPARNSIGCFWTDARAAPEARFGSSIPPTSVRSWDLGRRIGTAWQPPSELGDPAAVLDSSAVQKLAACSHV